MHSAKFTTLWLVLAAVTLAGCHELPVSIYPLYDERSLTFDPALAGSWQTSGEETWRFESSDLQTYKLLITESSADPDKPVATEFEAVLARLHGLLYLDVCSLDSGATGAPGHFFFKVRIEGNSLDLSPLDSEWIDRKLSEGAPLAHFKAHGKLVITASTIDLQRFFQQYSRDEEAFSENSSDGAGHFTRIEQNPGR